MKIAIMQPYFMPYIGYFQLISSVDEFVIYDNIQYTKKGWINRNRILVNGQDSFITLPLKNDSDYLNIVDRSLTETWTSDRRKMLNKLKESYRKALQFDPVYHLLEKIILFEDFNLFRFIYNSLILVMEYLEIKTPLVISSSIPIDHALTAEKKVIEICKARKATSYINPIGGVELYNKEEFKSQGLTLNFLKTTEITYTQFNNEFIPWLSVIDVMMFNTKDKIKEYLKSYYTLI